MAPEIPENWHELLPAPSVVADESIFEGIDDDPNRRSLHWTYTLQRDPASVQAVYERMASITGAQRAEIGILYPEIDNIGEPPFFGIIINANQQEDGLYEEAPADSIQVGGANLPLIVRRGYFNANQRAAGVGSTSYWATSRIDSAPPRPSGWITARHCATAVARAHSGRVVDWAPGCIDAALVAWPLHAPAITKTVSPYDKLYPGQEVNLDLASTTKARIVGVEVGLEPLRPASPFPLRFSMNAHGVSGDSGSKVCTNDSQPLGIYLGIFEFGHPDNWLGYGQSLKQLATIMKMEIYR
jgi:hypothetical protein